MNILKLFGASLLLAAVACEMSVAKLTGRAADEWTRSYPLTANGDVQIANTNGTIDIEGVDGVMVEVRAERIARAATDAAARELLPRITIKEDVSPSRIAIETDRLSGILIGVGVEVQYHVRVPKSARVRARTTNGAITAVALSGRLVAATTNGTITGTDLRGDVEARSTNGRVAIDLAALGSDLVDLRTTNGPVQLTLPDAAKATLSATCTNGRIDVADLPLDLMWEQSRRRVRGRLNGGGTPVELTTTNGPIRVRLRSAAESPSPK